MIAVVLQSVASLRDKNQSDIGRMAGVSRQRVSQWFNQKSADGFVNVESKNLKKLCDHLKIDLKELLTPLPCTRDPKIMDEVSTQLNWDKLYPDLICLLVACIKEAPDAVARVVQEYGLFAAANMLGKNVWTGFPRYKHFIKPARRRDLEHLWQFKRDLRIR